MDQEYRNQQLKIQNYLGSIVDHASLEIVVDCGAHKGYWSRVLLDELKGSRLPTIYAVEPFVTEELKECASDHTNIVIVDYALSDKNRRAGFRRRSMKNNVVGVSGMRRPMDASNDPTILKQCHTWDYFVDASNIGKVDLLKIDTEGAEKDILDSITKVYPTFIEVEFHQRTETTMKIDYAMAKFEVELFCPNRGKYDLVLDCSGPGSYYCFLYRIRDDG